MNPLTPHLDPVSEDALLVADSARALFSNAGVPRPQDRTMMPKGYRDPLWQQMLQLGWIGWNVPTDLGGSGLDMQAGMALHEALGAAAAPEPLTDIAILAAGLLRQSADARFHTDALQRLLAGNLTCCAVWQPDCADLPAGGNGVSVTTNADGNHVLNGTAGFASLPQADAFLLLAGGNGKQAIYWVPADHPGLSIQRTPRIDGREWADLHCADVVLDATAIIIDNDRAADVLLAQQDEARLALSAELLGAASEVFARTLEYMRTRQQFGQPLAAFQALQHRAVDLAAHLELTRSTVQHAAAVFGSCASSAERSRAASQAKARACASALAVIRGCIQLHGGIAYTEDCELGTYLKRAMVQAAWLGDAAFHQQRQHQLRQAPHAQSDTPAYPAWLQDMRHWIDENLDQALRFPARRQSWREAHAWHRQLHAKGWVAPAWPKEYGGMGLNPYEELLLHDVYESFGLNVFQNMGLTMLGPLLQKYGTKAQQAAYLPGILSGDTYWCQGYSEPEAGSDLASLRTRADIEGDHFVVNGQKIWTSLAHEADMMFLLARTDPHASKQEGISFLLVDMNTPGITVSPIVNLTGAQDFCSVFFDNVRVPRENLVGALNQGWQIAKSVLGSERIMIGHPRFAKAALHVLDTFVHTHAPEHAGLLPGLHAEITDLEALYVRYLNVLRNGGALGAETSILKLCSSQLWQKIAELLREMTGMHGTIDQRQQITDALRVHLPFQFLHALPSSIYGGTNEIQRNILAKRMLNL